MKKDILILFLMVVFGVSVMQAQTSINASGSNASGTGGSADYSVGQVVYTTNTGTNGSVAQGVQQPYEISVITGIKETAISLNMTAYPNPATDHLTLHIDENGQTTHDLFQLSFMLYDLSGKFLQNKKITTPQTNIDMSNYAAGTYFVKIISEEKSIKEFKIIKTQ
jgi:hypothetical protein